MCERERERNRVLEQDWRKKPHGFDRSDLFSRNYSLIPMHERGSVHTRTHSHIMCEQTDHSDLYVMQLFIRYVI